MTPADALSRLRQHMQDRELDAWIVPSADPHQSEYVSENWLRRGFITGFDGSAGTAAILAAAAGLWTDSRYFLQAAQQLEGSGVQLFRMGEPDVPTLEDWLVNSLSEGDRVGANPWVFSLKGWRELAARLDGAGVALVPVADDLVDRVWGDEQPAMPRSPVKVHPLELAGESVSDKLHRLEQALQDKGADAHLVCALDEIAWLFNLRGADVDFNPVFIAWALVERDGATLFTHLGRLDDEVREALPETVALEPYETVEEVLRHKGAEGLRIWVDPAVANRHLTGLLEEAGATLVEATGPIPAWKAAKNPVEIEGMRRAHVRDGVAMVRFLRWLEQAVPEGGVTERTAERTLERFRAEGDRFVGPSFNTIAGYRGHGAIVHYAADESSDATLAPEGIFLVDSGGQYLDGTTDITRTVALGDPTDEQRRAATAVLVGHLTLANATFREGTNGYQLDVLARAPLWAEHLNYGHGTGHGVGAYLCVHEGPFSVSLRKNLTALVPGNILSNEPGYYEEGEYGVRIENLVRVVEREQNDNGRFFGFEDLTLCPYDRRLIDVSSLTRRQIAQVDAYHARVREELSPHLDPADRAWLESATRPLGVPE